MTKLYLGTCNLFDHHNRHVFMRIAWADSMEEARQKINGAREEVAKTHGFLHSGDLLITEAL